MADFALQGVWERVFRAVTANAACTAANKFSTILLMGGRKFGERAGTRTRDHLIKSQVLYHLSYAPLLRRGFTGAAMPGQ